MISFKVIMMVGLPCCGKTHWVNKHVSENPDKRYTVLGNTNILDKMKVRKKSILFSSLICLYIKFQYYKGILLISNQSQC